MARKIIIKQRGKKVNVFTETIMIKTLKANKIIMILYCLQKHSYFNE